jgi:hypothetical protein
MASTRGERLRAARKKKFRSGRLAALALHVPVSTYGAHERAELPGGRDYGPEEAKRYARRFGVSPEWLLTGRRIAPEDLAFTGGQDAPKKSTVPVVGYVGAGGEAHYYAVSQGNLDEVEVPEIPTDISQIFEVKDTSLGPYFNRWMVFHDEPRDPPTPDLFGYLCVVALKDGRVLLRQIEPGVTEGHFDLIPQSGETIKDMQVAWAARVTTMAPPGSIRFRKTMGS